MSAHDTSDPGATGDRVARRRDRILDYVRRSPGRSARQVATGAQERPEVTYQDLRWLTAQGLLKVEQVPAGRGHHAFWYPADTPAAEATGGRVDVEAYKRAAVWRDGFVSRVKQSLALLDDAIAGAPISMERVQAQEARQKLARALKTSEGDLAYAQQIVAEHEQEAA